MWMEHFCGFQSGDMSTLLRSISGSTVARSFTGFQSNLLCGSSIFGEFSLLSQSLGLSRLRDVSIWLLPSTAGRQETFSLCMILYMAGSGVGCWAPSARGW